MKNRLFLAVFVLVGVHCSLNAQDIQFSQFYNVQMYQNPAFAGSNHSNRFMFHNRLQWPSQDARYSTAYFSFDGFSRKYSSGFGVSGFYDQQGNANFSTSQVSLQYAYEVNLNSRFTFRPGLEVGFANRYLNYAGQTYPSYFTDQSFIGGNNFAGDSRHKYADVSTGALFYDKNVWIGLSAHHLNTPNQSIDGSVGKLPAKFALTGGYKFHIVKQRTMEYSTEDIQEFTITPTFHYKRQGASQQLDLGIYGMYDNSLMLGVWYRGIPGLQTTSLREYSNESAILLLGYRYDKFSLSYSFDFTVSGLGTIRRTGGAHEINLTYVTNLHSNEHKILKRLPCPDFYKKMDYRDYY